ncbi:MAG: hypothetical protein CM15mP71_2040 [Candidatus Poseidoniales archaeon]|nr:MAG: hypothetical protein CM15mP71_2040 [Candidatus Poseidoniales archaeon]
MYMDGMVLKGHPNVDLISPMGPYLDEFAPLIDTSTPPKKGKPMSSKKSSGKNPPFNKKNNGVKIMNSKNHQWQLLGQERGVFFPKHFFLQNPGN